MWQSKKSSLLNRSVFDKSLKSRYLYEGSVCQLDVLVPIIENGHETTFAFRLNQTFCVI